jgi:hypothetical protein
MATVTPNFNWPVPTSTDLVKDGATAIEALGDSIDGSLVDLKGGTTGQVLSKTSNTDMDFTWVAADDTNAIQNSIVDAKGDLIAASANDTPARLAVGANDLLLTAASGEATGLKYTGAWTSFTPSFTNVTKGNGSFAGKYCQIGKMVFVKVNFNFGTTTSFSGPVQMAAPITGSGTIQYGLQSGLTILDSGTAWYAGLLGVSSEGGVELFVGTTGSTYLGRTEINATTPMTWTDGDQFWFSYYYEAA